MRRILPFFIFFLFSFPVLGSEGQARQDSIPVDKLVETAGEIIATMARQQMGIVQDLEDARAEGNSEKEDCLVTVLARFETLMIEAQDVYGGLQVQIDEDATAAASSYTMLITNKERADRLENNARTCMMGGDLMNAAEFSESMNVTAAVALVERRLGHIINQRIREISGGRLELPGSIVKTLDAVSLLFWNTLDRVRNGEKSN